MPNWENIIEPTLEPKVVSRWLDIPGSQLPSETLKIIERPARPARTKGATGLYSIEDALLMKFGRRLMALGITPHRVKLCVQRLRGRMLLFLQPYATAPEERMGRPESGPWFLLGRETATEFFVEVMQEYFFLLCLTEKGMGIESQEWKRERAERDELLSQRPELSILYGPDDGTVCPRSDYNPGEPAIIQNVSRFFQDQYEELMKHIAKMKR